MSSHPQSESSSTRIEEEHCDNLKMEELDVAVLKKVNSVEEVVGWKQISSEDVILRRILSFCSFQEQSSMELVNKQWRKCVNVEGFVLENNKKNIEKFDSELFPKLLARHGSNLKSFKVTASYWEQKNTKLITPQILVQLSKYCPDLEELHIPMCHNLTESDINPLRGLTKLNKLEKLDLSGCNLTDDHLKSLTGLRNIRELNLSINRYVSDLGIKYLFQASDSLIGSKIEALDLSFTSVSDNSLLCLRSLTNLKQLHLMQSSISPKCLSQLLTSEGGPTIEKLNLLNCTNITSLNFLKNYCKLRALMVSFSQKDQRSINDDIDFIEKQTSLKELVLVEVNLLNSPLLEAISKLSQLDTLSLRCKRIELKSKQLPDLLSKLTNLKKLDILCEQVDPIEEGILDIISRIPELEAVSVQCHRRAKAINLLDEILGKLSLSKMGHALKHFSVQVPGYTLGESGFRFLSKCSNLEALDAPIGDNIRVSAETRFNNLKSLQIQQVTPSKAISQSTFDSLIKSTNGKLEKLSCHQFPTIARLGARSRDYEWQG
ncbi:Hypothetical protein NAEGRDRAFT_80455 [Naegleria gruberi]|uniref:Uncharacterized protein n=1 Tax=Naegleria gruberi TaxID=5762 RepID=D2VLJ6_NAEGR|nr:uncharacterized protein NAEGRDRAFT_80455 [Naegleria gruberi]EFC42321.1 Hypothetical protein NAEGRDRAFT_80455 [Naegleria gruberi]|eukprot:XP_002675065.1 Hypothetical protein NAEGRDRAFT_80455 [Naegleria gruberi strain NEG-M]